MGAGVGGRPGGADPRRQRLTVATGRCSSGWLAGCADRWGRRDAPRDVWCGTERPPHHTGSRILSPPGRAVRSRQRTECSHPRTGPALFDEASEALHVDTVKTTQGRDGPMSRSAAESIQRRQCVVVTTSFDFTSIRYLLLGDIGPCRSVLRFHLDFEMVPLVGDRGLEGRPHSRRRRMPMRWQNR